MEPQVTEAEQRHANAEAYLASDDCARHIEYAQDVLATTNSFDAYWAGSASSSVVRDYRAGRAS
jgi:hypothetical protein